MRTREDFQELLAMDAGVKVLSVFTNDNGKEFVIYTLFDIKYITGDDVNWELDKPLSEKEYDAYMEMSRNKKSE